MILTKTPEPGVFRSIYVNFFGQMWTSIDFSQLAKYNVVITH